MPETKAKTRAKILQTFVKHPDLSYRAIKISEFKWGVGQFLKENMVAIVN